MRLTEYHAGVAVIKDKALLPKAMEKLAKAEDKEVPKPIVVPDDDMEPYRCPACNADLGFTDDYFGEVTDIKQNGRYCWKCGQKMC